MNVSEFMNVSYFVKTPCLFWAVSLIVSSLYGFRAWIYQHYDPYLKSEKSKEMKKWERVVVLHAHDFIYNFVCSMAGFHSLKLEVKILESITNLSGISVGTAAFLGLLTLIAIMGISGVLPRFFWKGALISSKW